MYSEVHIVVHSNPEISSSSIEVTKPSSNHLLWLVFPQETWPDWQTKQPQNRNPNRLSHINPSQWRMQVTRISCFRITENPKSVSPTQRAQPNNPSVQSHPNSDTFLRRGTVPENLFLEISCYVKRRCAFVFHRQLSASIRYWAFAIVSWRTCTLRIRLSGFTSVVSAAQSFVTCRTYLFGGNLEKEEYSTSYRCNYYVFRCVKWTWVIWW